MAQHRAAKTMIKKKKKERKPTVFRLKEPQDRVWGNRKRAPERKSPKFRV